MSFPSSTVGRKIIMALTGQVLVLFIVFHIAGNSMIFFHALNAYVARLYHFPAFVWGGRSILILAFIFHSYYGIVLKLENSKAKPDPYAVTLYRKATFAGRYQIWTGVLVLIFLVYHLLQFTLQVTNPAVAADTHPDMLGRPDVFTMVVATFRQIGIAGIYVISFAVLGLHLFHGMQSSIQTWGLNNEKTLPVFEKTGTAASVVLSIWYAAIPAAIVFHVLK